MSDKEPDKKSADNTDGCSPCEKGTTDFLMAGGVGVYGTGYFAVTGAMCPACVVIIPALVGVGAYKRIRYNKKKNPDAE